MKNILKFLLKRITMGLVTLWFVITLAFFLMQALPGDPFASERAIDPEVKKNLMIKYGLDKPLPEQYVTYLKNALKGDLGESMKNKGQTVSGIIGKSFPVSADLGARSMLLALAVGIPLGIVAGTNRGKKRDKITMLIAVIGISVPGFVIAILLQRYAVDFHNEFFVKSLGMQGLRLKISGWNEPSKRILPVIALGLFTVAVVARLMRTKMIEVMEQDYIKLAISKGVSRKNVILKHALRNSILPIITVMGPTIAGVLTGSIVVERIFSIPGLGDNFYTSIMEKDYTMVLGVTIFYSAFLIFMMIVVDILYVIVDPKIRLGKGDE